MQPVNEALMRDKPAGYLSADGQGAHLNILIVDDNKDDRESIKRYLSGTGQGRTYSFHEADWAQEALNLMDQNHYDCVFLDYQLPDMDGITFLKKIYNPNTGLTKSPTIMLTGQGSESVMLEALRLGAQDYLLKENITAMTVNVALMKASELYELKCSRQQAEEELHHSRKMEAVGQLTSGVAHDFNNLLTVVTGNLHLLRRRLNLGLAHFPPEDITAKIDAIDTVAKKGAELVRRLMVFTRQTPLSQEMTSLNDAINETAELLKSTLGEAIEIETILAPDLWMVYIDSSEFANILINFAVNARDAMPKGGKLTIETENVILDDSYALRHPDVTPGQYCMIAVSDTGKGMSPDILERIFEPFYTTKAAGEGTGLGLSMAYGFIQQCDGHVHAYSEEGRGTVFRIYLPRIAVDSEAAAPAEFQMAPRGEETILVVEDDDEMRSLAIAMLERLGYRTYQAKNARMALELMRREHRNIDMIFSDIFMPGGVNGPEMIAQMREYYPGIKVLYASGYTENTIPDYRLGASDDIISKPYRKEYLARKLRSILDEDGEYHEQKACIGG